MTYENNDISSYRRFSLRFDFLDPAIEALFCDFLGLSWISL